MAGIISTGSFPKLLWPGLNQIWGDAYKEHQPQYLMLFDKATSDKAYEEDVGITTFGLVPVKPEGTAIYYDSERQSYVSRYTHVTYGMGFVVTREEIEDNKYMDVGARGAKALAFAYNQTRENVGANVYNNGFTGGPTYGDGVSFFNGSHPIYGGTASNILSVAADLSEASLEQLLVNISLATDARGKKISLKGMKLIVPPQLMFDAKRILGDPERPGTADRDINAMYHMGMLPGGFEVNQYLTDPDAYFIRTDLKDGVRYFERRAAAFENDNDFSTENGLFKVTGRYSVGVTDWRSCFASPGY